jgi:hypothetical protein
MLEVITPATDPWLLTLDQMKEAMGVTLNDGTRDAELNQLRASLSAQIYSALNIAIGNGAEPTLRRETLREVQIGPASGPLILARRHRVKLLSLTGWHGGTTLDDYFVEDESGIVKRPGRHMWGCSGGGAGRVVIEYEAGFDEVPPALVAAAMDMVRLFRSETNRDPLVKREVVDVDGVERIEQEFWVTAAGATTVNSPIPGSILATLKRFRNSAYA